MVRPPPSPRETQHRINNFRQRLPLNVRPAESGVEAHLGVAHPAGYQAGAGRSLAVPGVGGDQGKLRRLDGGFSGGVGVDLGAGLLGADVVDRDDLVDEVVEARLLEQRLRVLLTAVG